MTKGMEENGGYHNRTELGIGQHDEIKRKLNEQRHQEYMDHVMRKDADKKRLDEERQQDYEEYQERLKAEEEREKSQSGSEEPLEVERKPLGVCDIGYETGRNIAEMRKHLNEERRAEYAAHLAARAAAGPVNHHETYNISTQISVGHQLAESVRNADSETFNLSETDGASAVNERRQKQLDYAEALRLQIEEKKRITAGDKEREDEEDRRNNGMMLGNSATFNYGSHRSSEHSSEQ